MNNTEALSQRLYDTALNELNSYLEDLETKSPQEVISSAYQIACKQDIVIILEEADFTSYELEILTGLERPLQVLYETWISTEDRYMEELRGSMQNYVDERLQHQAEILYADPQTPRYTGLYSEAQERGELHLLRASRKRDGTCMRAFEDGISEAHEKRAMREFVEQWTQAFGYDRCKFLLGYTVQRAAWDGRYSAASKREAGKLDYHITTKRDPFAEFQTNTHPCLVNYAFELLLEQERGRQKPAPEHSQMER